MRLWIVAGAGFCVVRLLLWHPAGADPPPGATPDPALSGWYKSLRKPGTKLACCSLSDCRVVSYQIRDGHFEVVIDDFKYVVPDGAILHKADNPTGEAVVCYRYDSFGLPLQPGQKRTGPQDTIEILCFIPPKPST